jgi:hypothetical protein
MELVNETLGLNWGLAAASLPLFWRKVAAIRQHQRKFSGLLKTLRRRAVNDD